MTYRRNSQDKTALLRLYSATLTAHGSVTLSEENAELFMEHFAPTKRPSPERPGLYVIEAPKSSRGPQPQ